jgi:hypothetical protein
VSAAPVRKPKPKARPFYTTVEVDVDPHDLEEAGWRYVGRGADKDEDDDTPTDEEVLEVVMRWHITDEHDLPWRWCRHPLCDELRGMS